MQKKHIYINPKAFEVCKIKLYEKVCNQYKAILQIEGDWYDVRSQRKEKRYNKDISASIAVTIKSVLDTPLLTEEGFLTAESETIVEKAGEVLEKTT